MRNQDTLGEPIVHHCDDGFYGLSFALCCLHLNDCVLTLDHGNHDSPVIRTWED